MINERTDSKMKTSIRKTQRNRSHAAGVALWLGLAVGVLAIAPVRAEADNYVTSSSTNWVLGTWIVDGNVTVSERITARGSVTLHLNEGATLNAQKGITVKSTLIIEGAGTLNATAYGNDPGRSAGIESSSGTLIINGGTVNALGNKVLISNSILKYTPAIRTDSLTINGGRVTATGLDGTAGIAADSITLGWTKASDFIETTGVEGTIGFVEGKRFYYAGTSEVVTSENFRGGRLLPLLDTTRTIVIEDAENGGVTADKLKAEAGDTVILTASSPYPYVLGSLTVVTSTGDSVDVERIDWTTYCFVMPDEDVVVTPVFAELSPVVLTTSEGEKSCLPVVPNQPSFDSSLSEWYAVTEDATLPERLNVVGDVKLYLCAGATLTCEKGLRVEAGNGLTIEGEGALVAQSYSPTRADPDHAAIGSNEQKACGDITIRSGTVTATGSADGAAIGAGYLGNGGSVTITGGKVTAIGGEYSPGIGTSYNASVVNTAITLGWTEEDDFIECSYYYGELSFMDGKEFLRADNLQIVPGASANGVRLIPKLSDAHTITVNSTGDGVLSASSASVVKNAPITLSWTTTNRYIIPTTLTVKDGDGQDIAVERTSLTSASFVMPDGDVTVTAVFEDVGHVAVTTSDGVVRDCRPITPHLGFGDYEAGNYAVTEDTTIGGRVVIGGDVMLYLCEGTTLTCGSGITVDGDNRLTVEGVGSLVADARGYNNSYAAGIGGGYRSDNAGTITINGGRVTAFGSESGAGIGGGSDGNSGTITINGGTVTATGGGTDGAGIGGGWGCSGATIAINGGTITATGGRNGAGIGGGRSCGGGTITINGGQVTATGGKNGAGIGGGYSGTAGEIFLNGGQIRAIGGESSAGIGCGYYGSGGRVTLNWTSTTDSIYASRYEIDVAIVPGKYFALLDTGEVATTGNINGQTIVPFTGATYAITENPGAYSRIDAVYTVGTDDAVKMTEAPAGIRVHVQCSILDEYYYEREITGLAVTGPNGDVAVTAQGGGVFQFVMPAGDVTLTPLTPEIVYYDISLTGDAHGGFDTYKRDFNDSDSQLVTSLGGKPLKAREGDTVHLSVYAIPLYYPYGITVATGNGENVAVTKHNDLAYEFVMPAGNVRATVQTAEIETIVRSTSEGEQTCLALRGSIYDWAAYSLFKNVYWYTMTNDVTISHTVYVESNLHARLYLTEGTTLICPGIFVEAGSSLTIEGEGTLIADASGEVSNENFYASLYHAGIGGGGTIIIKGGTITAKGVDNGAGIGGHLPHSGTGTGGYSGDITISGGTITAIGGFGAAGIGSSFRENCGVITISGGTVTASGGYGGAGIGGGYAASGDIRISGGIVNATGGYEGAGIGGGSHGPGGTITISGGVVTAQGGGTENYHLCNGYGAGIGEGSHAHPDHGEPTVIRITGGQITARGGWQYGDGTERYYSAGIGLGWRSQIGVCDITLGWTEESDYVDSDRYYGDVAFADDKFFKLNGTATLATPDNINGVRIVPALPSLVLLEGDGTGDSPWLIRSEREWNFLYDSLLLGENTSNKFFRQTADISVTNMLGTAEHPFAGTFDGGGHTLTVDIRSTESAVAPFSRIDGATISNLTVCGSVQSSGFHASGLVGFCEKTHPNTIADCTVSVAVSGAPYAGGLVGHGGEGTLRMEGCVFDGGIGGFGNFAGGLLGWCDALTLNISNCLFKGTFSPGEGGQFHPIACKYSGRTATATTTLACYLNTLEPTAPGDLLIPGAEGTRVSTVYVPGEWRYPYAAPDGNVYYLADAGAASAPDWDGVIRSDADWDLFAALLESGTDSFDGRTVLLDADIGVSNPAGTADHPFAGTFDGGGHALTVAITDNDRQCVAPFSRIDGATISNLVVTGSVASTQHHVAGLVGGCGNGQPSTLADCRVSVDIAAAGLAGGIVGHGYAGTLTMTGCVFSGTISGFGSYVGGLIGWGDHPTLTLRDCLCKGAFVPGESGTFHPIACKWGEGSVTLDIADVYYLNTLVPTLSGDFLVPGADGTPVSTTFVDGEWTRAVTAADGLVYYRQPSSSYADWAAETGIAGAWNEKDADGVANVFRYVFDVAEGTDGLRILGVTFDEQGRAVVQTPPVANSAGFEVFIVTADDPGGWQYAPSYPLDTDGETVIDEQDTGSRTRFYRLKAAQSE